MSLEDTAPSSKDSFELGDRIVTLEPGCVIDITPQLHLANHHKVSNSFYVQVIPVMVHPDKMAHTIIHLISKNREDELKPE